MILSSCHHYSLNNDSHCDCRCRCHYMQGVYALSCLELTSITILFYSILFQIHSIPSNSVRLKSIYYIVQYCISYQWKICVYLSICLFICMNKFFSFLFSLFFTLLFFLFLFAFLSFFSFLMNVFLTHTHTHTHTRGHTNTYEYMFLLMTRTYYFKRG